MNIFKTHAFDYWNKNYSVIPDRYMGKTPLIKGWSDWCATRAPKDQIVAWSEQFKESNIAVCLGKASNIIALDLDTIDKRILDVIYPMLPFSPVVKVGSKGETRFFKFNGEHTDKVTFNGECIIEVLSTGKKTTIPPSIHPNGAAYIWKSDKTLLDVTASSLPYLPPFLLSSIDNALKATFRLEVKAVNNYTETGRNNKLTALCGDLIRERVDFNKAIKILIETDKKDNNPPLFTDPEENKQTEPWTNACLMYSSVLHTANIKHYRNNEEYEIPLMPAPLDASLKELELAKKSLPLERGVKLRKPMLITAQGAIKTMQEYILKNSYKEQPAFALGASLAIMSSAMGRRFVFKNTAPNMYMLLLGNSGTGKQAPQDASHKILLDSNQQKLIGSGSYVSDASLMDTLETQPERLDTLDEASGILKTMTTADGNGYTAKMADILCNLWSTSNSIFLGRTMAAKKSTKCSACKDEIEESPKKGECYKPNVNLIMATTYTGLEESVTLSALDKGLLGRFLVFTADQDAKLKTEIDDTKIDREARNLIDNVRRCKILPNTKYNYKGIPYPVFEIPLKSGLDSVFEGYFEKFREIAKNLPEDSALHPIVARLPQQFKKIAMCHAMGRCIDPLLVEVNEVDLEFSYDVCLYNIDIFGGIINNYLYRSQRDKDFKIVLREIKKHPSILIDDLVTILRPYLPRKKILDMLNEFVISKEIERISSQDGEIGVRLINNINEEV